MEYHDLTTMYRAMKSQGDPSVLYGTLRRAVLANIREGSRRGRPEHNRILSEELWYEMGCPYYKVDNDSINLFSDINIDIPFRYLQVPFESFLIRFREDNPLGVRSMLVNLAENYEERPAFYVWADCGEKEKIPPHLPVLNYVHLPADDDAEIGKSIGALPLDESTGSDLSGGLDRKLVSIAVSVCFLATSSDKIIRPDVLSKDLAAWMEAGRKGDTQRQKTIQERAKRRGKHGYVVSGERELLHRPAERGEGGSGSELTHRHVRSSHFRRLANGKVTFIRQTVVRPDLPARTP